ncbi:MAG: hypothetical protein COB77_05300, partial [Gammaproteobacteria bacterium]
MNVIDNNVIEKHINSYYLKTYLVLISLSFIAMYVYAFYSDNGDIMINSHDNLDSIVAIYKVMADSDTFFVSNDFAIENIMNGLPRVALPRESNVISMLYYYFEPIDAYIINEALIRIIAFFGMLLLLQKHIVNNAYDNKVGYLIIITGTALTFSLLPYWSQAGISIAGQPLVLYAFLNIKNKDHGIVNWIILACFPFYSSLILAGMFVLSMLTVIFVYDWIKNKSINLSLISVLVMMSVLSLSAEYRLLDNFLNPTFISHRIEFVAKYLTLDQSLARSANLFFKGQTHSHSIHGVFILPFIFIYVAIMLLEKVIKNYSFRGWVVFFTISGFILFTLVVLNNYFDLQWKSVIKAHLSSNVAYYYLLVVSVILVYLLYAKQRMA